MQFKTLHLGSQAPVTGEKKRTRRCVFKFGHVFGCLVIAGCIM